MAISLVSTGTLTTTTSSPVAPAFGTSTTAGNCLFARVASVSGSTTSAAITLTGSGWTQLFANTVAVTNKPQVGMWVKNNCASGETAPSFSAANNSKFMAADLLEFNGILQITNPIDKSNSGTTSTLACSANDTNAADLALYVSCIVDTKKSSTNTITNAWTPSGGTAIARNDNLGVNTSYFFYGTGYLLGGHGGAAADTNTPTLTGFTSTTFETYIASFKPLNPPGAVVVSVLQAVANSANR